MISRNKKILALTAKGASAAAIATSLNCSLATVYNVRYDNKKAAMKHLRASVKLATVNTTTDIINKNTDDVNHPSHYKVGGIETIDYIESKALNYHLGNVVKYISRAGHKASADVLKDLKKAQWYLNRHIAAIEKAN